MPEKMQWNFNVQVNQGPRFSEAGSLEVDAYEKVQVTLEAPAAGGTTTKTVSLPPGISFLALSASQYGEALSYALITGAPPTAEASITLEAPLVLLGTSATAHFAPHLSGITFTNGLDQAVVVDILLALDATPL